jgi:FtsP/CotA-like multicopper oxidase with cupredoxin domain
MQSRRISVGLAVAGIAVAVGLFIVLSDDDGSDSGSTTTATRTTTTDGPPKTTSTAPEPPTIAFRNGAPVGGVQEIEVAKGDPVRIDVTSDVPAEVHVHGYELTEELKAGQTAKLDFPASLEGVFEIELHLEAGSEEGSEVLVADVNVTP